MNPQNILASLLGNVKAKLAVEEKNKPPEGAEASKKVLTYHEKQRKMKAEDPANSTYAIAIETGKMHSKDFMAKVLDDQHPGHAEAFKNFKAEYEMDARKCEADHITKACQAKNTGPYEMADPAYEQHLIGKYKPAGSVTHQAIAFHANFARAMKAKWDKEGYKGDKAFVEAYADKYGLTPSKTD